MPSDAITFHSAAILERTESNPFYAFPLRKDTKMNTTLTINRFTLIGWALALAGLLIGCETSGRQPQFTEAQTHRQVVDKDTGSGIPGAIVAFKWIENQGFSMGGSNTACTHVAMLHTDDQGRYTIPNWRGQTLGASAPYKPGYSEVNDPVAWNQGIDYMKRSVGSTRQRYEELFRIINTFQCDEAEERNLLELYRAFYDEARSIAKNREDALLADRFLIRVDAAMFGSDEASRRDTERTVKRTKEQQTK
jgi:hypothetical protein